MNARRAARAVLFAGATAAVAILGACAGDAGDSDGDRTVVPTTAAKVGVTGTAAPQNATSTREVEEDVRAALAAQDGGDVDRFLTYWTPRGLQAEFGVTPEEVRAGGKDAIQTELEARQFRQTAVDGERATTLVEIGSGEANDDEFVFARSVELVRRGDRWMIDNTTPIEVQAPSGVRTVNVDMADFAFRFQASEYAQGDAHIRAHNVGTQPHEVVLVRVPDNFNLEEALLSEDEPEGLTFIAATMAKPGQTSSVLVLKDLEAGRHIMACFLPDTTDPQGTPHALKGMVADFRIQ